MRQLYSIFAAFLLIAALPIAAYPAEAQSGTSQAVEKTAQESKETAKEAILENLERQEDKQSTSEYLDDAAITAKVKTKFLATKGLDSLEIKVVTVDGTVTLIGDVDDAGQVALAGTAAMEVGGVRKVENDLMVKK